MLYLDHAATTPLRAEVAEAMAPFWQERFGNPSSLHHVGKAAHKALREARAQIAQALGGVDPSTLIATSGATEANNLALKGLAFGLRHQGRHLISTPIEHPSVLEPLAWLRSEGWDITFLPPDAEGRVSPDDLAAALRPDTVLVSIMHGNNEIGVLQPLEALGSVTRAHNVLFHVDAVQTVGKLPLNLTHVPVDCLSLSAHKLYGPKGVGLLYANIPTQTHLTPWLHGGGQESGCRSGTENLPGLVGLATALTLALEEQPQLTPRLHALQERLLTDLLALAPEARLNGPRNVTQRVPGNVNVSFPPLEGEALVLRLDLEGICVSSGSACHQGRLTGSHVLHALGTDDATAQSSLRLSLGRTTTEGDLDRFLDALPRALAKAGYPQPLQTHPSCSPAPSRKEG